MSLFVAACSGDSTRPVTRDAAVVTDAATDAATDLDTGSTGTGSLTALSTAVYAACPTDTAAPACPAQIQIIVYGVALERIAGATVTVNGDPVPDLGDGTYAEVLTGLAASYSVRATLDGGEIAATLDAPSDFSFTITPDPPRAGEAATVAWSPSGQEGIMAEVQVHHASGDPFIMSAPDSGELVIPPAAFPMPGPHRLSLSRQAFQTGPESGSTFSIVLARETTITAE